MVQTKYKLNATIFYVLRKHHIFQYFMDALRFAQFVSLKRHQQERAE